MDIVILFVSNEMIIRISFLEKNSYASFITNSKNESMHSNNYQTQI